MAKLRFKSISFYTALLALGSWSSAICPAQDLPISGIPDPSVLIAAASNENTIESSFVDITAVDAPAIHTEGGKTGLGSEQRFGQGIIIDSDGIIVTNKHITGQAQHIYVHLSTGENFEANIIRNTNEDLSFIKINAPFPLKAIAFADASEIQIGNYVIAIPNSTLKHPGKLGGQIIKIFTASQSNQVELMEINIPLNPGDSGGPILNENGSLMGLIMGKQISDPSKSFCIASSRIQQEYFNYRNSILN